MPGREGSSTNYRFGFNGMERDDEVKGSGNSINYKYRVHDPRIGRFLSLDPLARQYSWNSPYAFAENRVTDGIDLEGLEAWQTTRQWTPQDLLDFQDYNETTLRNYQESEIKYDCANLAVSVLIGFTQDRGLPVQFHGVNGEVYTNENLLINGFEISNGDTRKFENAIRNSTNASSLQQDMNEVNSEHIQIGDLTNTGVHVEIIVDFERNELERNRLTVVAGNNPAVVPRKYSYFTDEEIKRWTVMDTIEENWSVDVQEEIEPSTEDLELADPSSP